MRIEITSETHKQLKTIAATMKLTESEAVRRCIQHRYKMLRAIEKHRQSHPNRGWGRTSEYDIWRGILRRCLDPKCVAYPNYGGRGIKVAPELQTFQGFLAVVGRRPEGMSLDRIDNDGDYIPGNLRWATNTEQRSNTRTNDLIAFAGKTQTLTAWARELGISQGGLWNRLYKFKWPIDQAFNSPILTRSECAQRATKNAKYRLTEDDIRTIKASRETQAILAARYQVGPTTISRIKTGKRWGHIT